MRNIVILLTLLCGCMSSHEIKVEKLEQDVSILELKVRKFKLTSWLDDYLKEK